MTEKIKFAVLGAGHIGKKHAEMILNNSEAEFVALIDIKPKPDLKLEYFNVPFFSSLDSFLQSDTQADVINICTPNGLHAPQALECLEKDHHVVIEKPIALAATDVRKIIDTAKNRNKNVFPVMQNRYSPPATWIKNIITQGILGKVYMVQLNCYWNRDSRYYNKQTWHGSKQLDGGTLYTQFSHFIDIMYWLLGDINNITSRLKNFNHQGLTEFEDSGSATFEFINGGIGTLNFSTSVWDTNMESSITIIADNGSVRIAGQYMDKIKYCHIKDYTLPEIPPVSDSNDYGHYKGSAANHHFVIENVIDVLKSRAPITTTAAEALKVVDIIERIYGAAQ